MSKSILIIGDALAMLKISSDSSLALAQGALECGYAVYWCEPKDIGIWGHTVVVQSLTQLVNVTTAQVTQKSVEPGPAGYCNVLRDFDGVFVRKDPPFDEHYVTLCWMLSLSPFVRVINPARRLLEFHEKTPQLRALAEGYISAENIVPSYVGYSVDLCEIFLKQNNISDVIVKPWLGYGGRSVHRFENTNDALHFLKQNPSHLWIVQPFLPEIFTQGDRRVVMIKGEIFCSFVRKPSQGKVASNLAQGGRAQEFPLLVSQQKLLDAVGNFLKYHSIDFAGVDLIGNKIGEINITSPTGIRTSEELTGTSLGASAFRQLMGLLL